ncbi:G1/S-specific cyclin pcl5 [Trichophyton equinum CBS 127.97]|uniref:G1/S-specific cyclin pcl5 n=1 Tax=Trichophyton equinum (strain ATCC MYA-4606 / CBS 127.97) TaxID=559882 RepID=F2Q5K3_TRIEC|nr:G1/S-specific cyclin pcl5 [Trichophyton equinum CBS 127.97]
MSAFVDILGFNPVNPGLSKPVHQTCPYAASLAASAPPSASSIFSLDAVSSQPSVVSSSSTADVIWENEETADAQHKKAAIKTCFGKGAETRHHPRRTLATRPPPTLVRQCERKTNFVDSLVDSASQIVEIIWPLSVAAAPRSVESTLGCKGVLPLRTFIQETLRRSRTSYSTLQVALYYLILIKPHVPSIDFTMEQPKLQQSQSRAMQCGRRMFLSALILASKYLQDRNYSARAWSKISGLNTAEINQNELMFLQAVDWRLHISDAVFQRWNDIVLKYTPNASGIPSADGMCWRTVIPILTPELDTLDSRAEGPWSLSSIGSPADSSSASSASSSSSPSSTSTAPSSPASCDSPSSGLPFTEMPRDHRQLTHEPSYISNYPSPPLRTSSAFSTASSTVPDLSNFSINTPSDPDAAAIQGLYELATGFSLPMDSSLSKASRHCRKRTRAPSTSEGTNLQQKVRHLMALDARDLEDEGTSLAVLSDSQVADSFLVNKVAGMGDSRASSKRACSGKENVRTLWGI